MMRWLKDKKKEKRTSSTSYNDEASKEDEEDDYGFEKDRSKPPQTAPAPKRELPPTPAAPEEKSPHIYEEIPDLCVTGATSGTKGKNGGKSGTGVQSASAAPNMYTASTSLSARRASTKDPNPYMVVHVDKEVRQTPTNFHRNGSPEVHCDLIVKDTHCEILLTRKPKVGVFNVDSNSGSRSNGGVRNNTHFCSRDRRASTDLLGGGGAAAAAVSGGRGASGFAFNMTPSLVSSSMSKVNSVGASSASLSAFSEHGLNYGVNENDEESVGSNQQGVLTYTAASNVIKRPTGLVFKPLEIDPEFCDTYDSEAGGIGDDGMMNYAAMPHEDSSSNLPVTYASVQDQSQQQQQNSPTSETSRGVTYSSIQDPQHSLQGSVCYASIQDGSHPASNANSSCQQQQSFELHYQHQQYRDYPPCFYQHRQCSNNNNNHQSHCASNTCMNVNTICKEQMNKSYLDTSLNANSVMLPCLQRPCSPSNSSSSTYASINFPVEPKVYSTIPDIISSRDSNSNSSDPNIPRSCDDHLSGQYEPRVVYSDIRESASVPQLRRVNLVTDTSRGNESWSSPLPQAIVENGGMHSDMTQQRYPLDNNYRPPFSSSSSQLSQADVRNGNFNLNGTVSRTCFSSNSISYTGIPTSGDISNSCNSNKNSNVLSGPSTVHHTHGGDIRLEFCACSDDQQSSCGCHDDKHERDDDLSSMIGGRADTDDGNEEVSSERRSLLPPTSCQGCGRLIRQITYSESYSDETTSYEHVYASRLLVRSGRRYSSPDITTLLDTPGSLSDPEFEDVRKTRSPESMAHMTRDDTWADRMYTSPAPSELGDIRACSRDSKENLEAPPLKLFLSGDSSLPRCKLLRRMNTSPVSSDSSCFSGLRSVSSANALLDLEQSAENAKTAKVPSQSFNAKTKTPEFAKISTHHLASRKAVQDVRNVEAFIIQSELPSSEVKATSAFSGLFSKFGKKGKQSKTEREGLMAIKPQIASCKVSDTHPGTADCDVADIPEKNTKKLSSFFQRLSCKDAPKGILEVNVAGNAIKEKPAQSRVACSLADVSFDSVIGHDTELKLMSTETENTVGVQFRDNVRITKTDQNFGDLSRTGSVSDSALTEAKVNVASGKTESIQNNATTSATKPGNKTDSGDTCYEYDISTSSEGEQASYDYFLSKVKKTLNLEHEVQHIAQSSSSARKRQVCKRCRKEAGSATYSTLEDDSSASSEAAAGAYCPKLATRFSDLRAVFGDLVVDQRAAILDCLTDYAHSPYHVRCQGHQTCRECGAEIMTSDSESLTTVYSMLSQQCLRVTSPGHAHSLSADSDDGTMADHSDESGDEEKDDKKDNVEAYNDNIEKNNDSSGYDEPEHDEEAAMANAGSGRGVHKTKRKEKRDRKSVHDGHHHHLYTSNTHGHSASWKENEKLKRKSTTTSSGSNPSSLFNTSLSKSSLALDHSCITTSEHSTRLHKSGDGENDAGTRKGQKKSLVRRSSCVGDRSNQHNLSFTYSSDKNETLHTSGDLNRSEDFDWDVNSSQNYDRIKMGTNLLTDKALQDIYAPLPAKALSVLTARQQQPSRGHHSQSSPHSCVAVSFGGSNDGTDLNSTTANTLSPHRVMGGAKDTTSNWEPNDSVVDEREEVKKSEIASNAGLFTVSMRREGKIGVKSTGGEEVNESNVGHLGPPSVTNNNIETVENPKALKVLSRSGSKQDGVVAKPVDVGLDSTREKKNTKTDNVSDFPKNNVALKAINVESNTHSSTVTNESFVKETETSHISKLFRGRHKLQLAALDLLPETALGGDDEVAETNDVATQHLKQKPEPKPRRSNIVEKMAKLFENHAVTGHSDTNNNGATKDSRDILKKNGENGLNKILSTHVHDKACSEATGERGGSNNSSDNKGSGRTKGSSQREKVALCSLAKTSITGSAADEPSIETYDTRQDLGDKQTDSNLNVNAMSPGAQTGNELPPSSSSENSGIPKPLTSSGTKGQSKNRTRSKFEKENETKQSGTTLAASKSRRKVETLDQRATKQKSPTPSTSSSSSSSKRKSSSQTKTKRTTKKTYHKKRSKSRSKSSCGIGGREERTYYYFSSDLSDIDVVEVSDWETYAKQKKYHGNQHSTRSEHGKRGSGSKSGNDLSKMNGSSGSSKNRDVTSSSRSRGASSGRSEKCHHVSDGECEQEVYAIPPSSAELRGDRDRSKNNESGVSPLPSPDLPKQRSRKRTDVYKTRKSNNKLLPDLIIRNYDTRANFCVQAFGNV